MACNFESDTFLNLGELVKENTLYIKRTGNDESYNKFISQYPSSSIAGLSLDQYCLGKDSQSENFCWWLERGLEKVLGRYSPGSSRGHILYKDKDGSIYRNRKLADLEPNEALNYTLAVHSVIANADLSLDLTWIDEDSKVFERAGVEEKVTIGDGRKLRLLSAYNPDDILPISSSNHLGHFLLSLGHPEGDIPDKKKPVARMLLLKEYFRKAKEQFNSDLTPFGFTKALYNDDLGIKPVKPEKGDAVELTQYNESTDPAVSTPLNQILFGPPGTGKTFNTTAMAVKIADTDWYKDKYEEDISWDEFYQSVKIRYDELVDQKRIVFTTFHQSFSYEDFIEGIRATTDEKTGSLSYEIQDGVFKQLCDAADSRVTRQTTESIDLSGRRIWKMSLGNTLEDDDSIYQECLENNYVLLGYGGDIDFTGCDSRASVREKLEDATGKDYADNNYSLTSVHNFKNVIKKGDIVVISDGNHKFRTIGEVCGDYGFLNTEDRSGYQQLRSVKWLSQYEPSLPREKLFKKALSQMTLYELKDKTIDREKLSLLLSPALPDDQGPLPHVLIIDEINRGNIARIFGELITLLEDSKRKGNSDAMQVTLPYSKEPFSVPSNVYVIGTMNTADKSLAQLDLALRRRFSFVEMPPKPELLNEITIHGLSIAELLATMNQRIEVLLDRDHLIGHSYFLGLQDKEPGQEQEEALAHIFSQKVIPLLQEYFFDDWERIGWVLNDDRKPQSARFIHTGGEKDLGHLFSQSVVEQLSDQRFRINTDAFHHPEAYQGIVATGAPN